MFCILLSLQFLGCHFALQSKLSDKYKKVVDFQFVQLSCCCFKDGSEDFQAFHMSESKVELSVINMSKYKFHDCNVSI